MLKIDASAAATTRPPLTRVRPEKAPHRADAAVPGDSKPLSAHPTIAATLIVVAAQPEAPTAAQAAPTAARLIQTVAVWPVEAATATRVLARAAQAQAAVAAGTVIRRAARHPATVDGAIARQQVGHPRQDRAAAAAVALAWRPSRARDAVWARRYDFSRAVRLRLQRGHHARELRLAR
jgi:hypothetical protein